MKTQIYPKNKPHFKKLIPFAQIIIKICKDNGMSPVIYGSFSHFYHTHDEKMKVNDIDLLIPEGSFIKLSRLLEKNKIGFEYYPQWNTLVVKKGKLKVEVDNIGTGYKTMNEKTFFKKFEKIDFYGVEVGLLSLEQLEEMYPVAYNRSKEDKVKLLKRIRHLEKFLGRRLV